MTIEINLTENAISKIKEIAAAEGLQLRIRAGIKGGGCSGYIHSLHFEDEDDVNETDHMFTFDGVELVVDMVSMSYIEGTTIDYKSGLMESGFKFMNPKAKSTCGCQKSFSM